MSRGCPTRGRRVPVPASSQAYRRQCRDEAAVRALGKIQETPSRIVATSRAPRTNRGAYRIAVGAHCRGLSHKMTATKKVTVSNSQIDQARFGGDLLQRPSQKLGLWR